MPPRFCPWLHGSKHNTACHRANRLSCLPSYTVEGGPRGHRQLRIQRRLGGSTPAERRERPAWPSYRFFLSVVPAVGLTTDSLVPAGTRPCAVMKSPQTPVGPMGDICPRRGGRGGRSATTPGTRARRASLPTERLSFPPSPPSFAPPLTHEMDHRLCKPDPGWNERASSRLEAPPGPSDRLDWGPSPCLPSSALATNTRLKGSASLLSKFRNYTSPPSILILCTVIHSLFVSAGRQLRLCFVISSHARLWKKGQSLPPSNNYPSSTDRTTPSLRL